MKRSIKASKHTEKANRSLDKLVTLGEILTEVASARNDDDAVAAAQALSKLMSSVYTQREAIHSVVNMIDLIAGDYLQAANTEFNLPAVIDELVYFLKDCGYDVTEMSTPPRGADVSYVIVPADECSQTDLKEVALTVSKHFGIRPDTGVIGGSWTSYQFKLDGVPFRIGFEEDKDFDPSGRESSLQLYF